MKIPIPPKIQALYDAHPEHVDIMHYGNAWVGCAEIGQRRNGSVWVTLGDAPELDLGEALALRAALTLFIEGAI